jgi:hypothetical protein
MAATARCLYVSTVDGRIMCFSEAGDRPLRTVVDQPERIDWDQPEDPNYLLPAEISKEDDFDQVTGCKITEADLGYQIRATTKGQLGIALRKLETPATGTVTLETQLAIPTTTTRMNRNGFLVFGDRTAEAALIKCGVRFKGGRAMVMQGPFAGGQAKGVSIQVPPDGQTIEMRVTVDLAARQVTFNAAGESVTATLEQPLKAITHVGYLVDNALVDFAAIEALAN